MTILRRLAIFVAALAIPASSRAITVTCTSSPCTASITFTGTIVPSAGLSIDTEVLDDGTMVATYNAWLSGSADAFNVTEKTILESNQSQLIALHNIEIFMTREPEMMLALQRGETDFQKLMEPDDGPMCWSCEQTELAKVEQRICYRERCP